MKQRFMILADICTQELVTRMHLTHFFSCVSFKFLFANDGYPSISMSNQTSLQQQLLSFICFGMILSLRNYLRAMSFGSICYARNEV